MGRTTRHLPRATLAKNLRYLMDLEGLSEDKMAKRAGVAQKTINKILNQVGSPTLDTVDKIASAFGLNLWHMILPDLPNDLINSPSIERLYRAYSRSSKEGREYIERVAEKEAAYEPIDKNGL